MTPQHRDQFAVTRRRLEAARTRTLRRDARRPIGQNLEEGARLALAATTLARAFATARR